MEILILGLIAFLVFGPEQFPVVVRNFIRVLNELRRTFTDVKSEIYDVEVEVEKQIRQITDGINEDLESVKNEMQFEDKLENAGLTDKPSSSTSSLSSEKGESQSIELSPEASESSKSEEASASQEFKKE